MLSRLADGSAWLPLALLMFFLFALAAAELWRPLRTGGEERSGRIPSNLALGLINIALALVLPVSAVFAAEFAAREGIGLMNMVPTPLPGAILATIALRSLSIYLAHRTAHRIGWMWRVHRVHHSDTALDLSTGLRNHPLEFAWVVPWVALVTVAFGLHAPTLIVYEAVAFGFALWGHANFDVPERLDRPIRLLFVTPAMHLVHHSSVRAETDSNYGDTLSLWDRLFGTYRALDAEALQATRIGLGDAFDPGAASLIQQLRLPLLDPEGASEARQEGGEIGAERLDRIAALHHHESRQP
jgi:sterol desaturase/sphingolipid hydroxylase (fatty acid hydroxylase superfamily)